MNLSWKPRSCLTAPTGLVVGPQETGRVPTSGAPGGSPTPYTAPELLSSCLDLLRHGLWTLVSSIVSGQRAVCDFYTNEGPGPQSLASSFHHPRPPGLGSGSSMGPLSCLQAPRSRGLWSWPLFPRLVMFTSSQGPAVLEAYTSWKPTRCWLLVSACPGTEG